MNNLLKKIARGAKCCTPRYKCGMCPYREYNYCYEKMIEDILFFYKGEFENEKIDQARKKAAGENTDQARKKADRT